MKKKAFTLNELLVVIVIISVLASLLLPSLRHAFMLSRALSCANNLKNNYMAATLYSGENNDWCVPAHMTWSGVEITWVNLLSGVNVWGGAPFSANYGLLYSGRNLTEGTQVCPNEELPFSPTVFPYGHYGINSYLGTCNSYYLSSAQHDFYLSKRWPSIKRPSIAIFVGDTVRRDSPHINNIRFFGMRHGTVGSDDRDPSAVAFPNDLTQSYANLIFMDGHSGKTNYTNASNTSAPVSSTVLPAESYFLYAGIAN